MKVLLLENVEGVGAAGELADVADGFARNVLFPQGKAAAATTGRVKEAAARQARATQKSEKELAALQRLVDLLDQKTVTVTVPAGPQGLHGAVTADDIAATIARSLQVTLPKRSVQLREPLRKPGESKVTLAFPHGLEAEMTVIVEAELAPPPTIR